MNANYDNKKEDTNKASSYSRHTWRSTERVRPSSPPAVKPEEPVTSYHIILWKRPDVWQIAQAEPAVGKNMILTKKEKGLLKTPEIRRGCGIHQYIKHLYSQVILSKLSAEPVQTSIHRGHTVYPNVITLHMCMLRHINPPMQTSQKVSITFIGQPRWRKENKFKLRTGGSSVIMMKISSIQLSLNVDEFPKLPYCAKHEQMFDEIMKSNLDI